jgi:hypothetical protein
MTPPEALEGLKPLPLPVKTPLTSKSIRRIQRNYCLDPSPSKLDLLFRSQQKLAAQHEIDRHIQGGLLETLKDEKKRRQRGKQLNLVGEQASSAELWDTAKITLAQELAQQKTNDKVQEKEDKLAAKERKSQGKLEKAIAAHNLKVEKVKIARSEYLCKNAIQEAKTLAKLGPKQSLIIILEYAKGVTHPAKAICFASVAEEVESGEGSKLKSTRTRAVKLPARYKK